MNVTNKAIRCIRMIWFAVLLMVVFTVGCDNDRGFRSAPVLTVLTPTVIYTIPGDYSDNVPVNRKITAAFSEPMIAATVTDSAVFTVKGPGGSSVTGTILYNDGSNSVLFSPSGNLGNNTTYIGTVTAGGRNTADIALAYNYVWSFTTSAATDVTAPLLVNTVPGHTTISVPLNQIITATFNEPMDPVTITTLTFTVINTVTSIPVAGNVSYAGTTATFTPSGLLAVSTGYTVEIAGSDLAGNALIVGSLPNPWTFTTGTVSHLGPEPLSLGTSGTFRILSGSTITNTGVTGIDGDAGVFPGTAVTGFPPGTVTGTLYAGGSIAETAKADLLAAYNDALSRSANAISLPGQIGGLTLAPGLYVNSSSSGISGTGANAILTLDGHGDPNAVWIFKMGSTFITDPNTLMVLINNAQADNIFWQVGSSATLGTNSIFYGTILSDGSITITTEAVLHGRALTRVGAVTLDTNQVVP